jgi:hypothetical protein
MLEESQGYFSSLSIENDIKQSLSYEKVIKEYAAKKCRKKSVIEDCPALNTVWTGDANLRF